jgi:hypothetical protein
MTTFIFAVLFGLNFLLSSGKGKMFNVQGESLGQRVMRTGFVHEAEVIPTTHRI